MDFESKELTVSDWTITRTLAIGFASALAIAMACPLYARLPSDGRSMEQSGSNDLMALDGVLALGAPSGSAIVSLVSSRNYVSRSQRSDPDAYTIRRPDDMALNNNGPDNYLAPKYRDGKCVADEGNTLVAEPMFGGDVRKMEGKALEQALAVLCREAAL
jgi:hypothetical protein